MTGIQQSIESTPNNKIEIQGEPSPRSEVNTSKIISLDMEANEIKQKKKKHINSTYRAVGIIGCLIVGFIVYNLIVNYSGLLY